MERNIWIAVVVVFFGGIGYLYYLKSQTVPPPAVTAAPAPAPAAAAPAQPEIQNPVPEPATPGAVPALESSDDQIRAALEAVFGRKNIKSMLVPQHVVQKLVAVIDSLDRKPVPLTTWPVEHVPSLPLVDQQGEQLFLSPKNADRYHPYVAALQEADARAIAEIYLRHYPLFQQAYEELGYPGQYFNDRLVQIIDHLLATPDVVGPIPLVRPKVLYQFADPVLEQSSSGRKMLIRIGAANAAVVKGKLREIRAVIARKKN